MTNVTNTMMCSPQRHVYGWPETCPTPRREADGWHSRCQCGEMTLVDRGDSVVVLRYDGTTSNWLPA